MNSVLFQRLVLAGLVATGSAHASQVTFETASSFGPDQASAAAYKSVVNAALALPGGHSAVVPLYDELSNLGVFGASNNNVAYRVTVDFAVSAADAGAWGLRLGGDFGYGGAVFLDGVALGFKSGSMWWDHSYADLAQSFQFSAVPMTAGQHTLQLFALEDCCDGGQQAQFSIKGAPYVTFGSADGLAIGVPEPSSWVLMGAGLGGLGLAARRRRRG
jgi:hypothetical protein